MQRLERRRVQKAEQERRRPWQFSGPVVALEEVLRRRAVEDLRAWEEKQSGVLETIVG
jgi:hypothetical protein